MRAVFGMKEIDKFNNYKTKYLHLKIVKNGLLETLIIFSILSFFSVDTALIVFPVYIS